MQVATSITTLSATEIAQQIARRELTSAEVVEAFIRRIQQVNPQLNAVVVDRFNQARSEAVAADAATSNGQCTGLLHGVPITIKEMFDVAGLPTTVGLTELADQRAASDAATVSRLRNAGAIVLAKTNVPQLGMMAESDNPVYGRTNNPWDVRRGPGGSSGGEAAIISAGGSPLGLGSDGGGSIRFPAHVCGLCGFKPTGGRLTLQGHWLSANWPLDWAQPGPMAHTVDDLILAMRVLTDTENPSFDEAPAPWLDPADVQLKCLRVGVYDQFPALPAAPAMKRAVAEAAGKLSDLGVETIPFEPFEVGEIWKLYMQIFYAEGLRDIRNQLRGSVVDWRTRNYLRLAQLPTLSRPAIAALANTVGQSRIGETLTNLKRPTVAAQRYCQLLARQREFRQRFQQVMAEHRLDALIGPPAPITAFHHGDFYANYALMYNGVYNLLAVPAGAVHVTRVREDEQIGQSAGRDAVDRSMARTVHDSAGLPVGVQVISTRWKDHVVLALMKALHQPSRPAGLLS